MPAFAGAFRGHREIRDHGNGCARRDGYDSLHESVIGRGREKGGEGIGVNFIAEPRELALF